MILDKEEFQTLEEFIVEHCGTELGANAYIAWNTYRNDNENTDTYAVIRVKGYYAITKITDEWRPTRVSEFVQPFDEKRAYPLQKVQKVIEFVY